MATITKVLTVKELKEILSNIPDHYNVNAYEGESNCINILDQNDDIVESITCIEHIRSNMTPLNITVKTRFGRTISCENILVDLDSFNINAHIGADVVINGVSGTITSITIAT